MSRPVIRIHNAETNEIIDREMTDEEFAQYENDQAIYAAEKAAQDAKISAAASAVSKLEAIGLTAEEIAALRG